MHVMTEWGRIAKDGTVYVRTAEGERAIGSWQAGTVEEGIAFYVRRYDDIAAEVGILEARIESTSADPKAVAAAAVKLKESLPTASAIGDLDGLAARLDAVLQKVDARRTEHSQAR